MFAHSQSESVSRILARDTGTLGTFTRSTAFFAFFAASELSNFFFIAAHASAIGSPAPFSTLAITLATVPDDQSLQLPITQILGHTLSSLLLIDTHTHT